MTFADYLFLLALVVAVVAFLVARALLRFLFRAARRMERQAERRLVDAVFVALGLHWLAGRGQRSRRAHPTPPRPATLEGDEIYRACPLSGWKGDPAACRWCNRVLPARSARFCRPECARAARENHQFDGAGGARETALARDGYRCRWAGCGAAATHEHALEVHHVVACHGRHGVPGCWHHLAGLVTLCHTHHLVETDRQRAAGEFGPPRPGPWRIGA